MGELTERIASYRAALQILMDQYPGAHANLPFVVAHIMSKVDAHPSQFHFLHQDITQFILGLENRGEVETKRGGLVLKWLKAPDGEMIPSVAHAIPTDNYTCARCKCTKLNTSNDKVCWSCGEPVVGYTGG